MKFSQIESVRTETALLYVVLEEMNDKMSFLFDSPFNRKLILQHEKNSVKSNPVIPNKCSMCTCIWDLYVRFLKQLNADKDKYLHKQIIRQCKIFCFTSDWII